MNEVKLLAVGDILLQTRNNDKHPFNKVEKIFEGKDILFGNLETVLCNKIKKLKKAVTLSSSPKDAKYLKDADFDVINIANNHILDCGQEGFNSTVATLDTNGLNFIGANNDVSIPSHLILERNGIKFGFLGYTTGRFKAPKDTSINKLKEEKILADVKAIKERCDFVIISLHWGIEFASYPSPKQIDFAHKLIDNGVTLILGHHPHVIQGIEEYKKGLIAYSLGNFQFRLKLSQGKITESILLCVYFSKGGIKKYEVLPIKIDEDFLPEVAEGPKKDKVLNHISDLSQAINCNKITENWWYGEIARNYLSNNMNSYRIRIKKYGIRPAIECAIWLITPFCIRCYAGIITQRLKCSRKAEK